MRVLIIEDEIHNSQRLAKILQEVEPGVQILAILEGVEDTVNWLEEHEDPDLIFMDVRLTDGLSFDIFTKTEVKCPIIFTSAFDQYALRAFKVNSVDYLLKPVNKNELQQSIDKFKASLKMPFMPSTLNDISAILTQQKKNYRSRFLLPIKDSYLALSVDEISYFVTEYRVTKAVVKNDNEYVIPFTLEELEEQLDPDIFFRVSRQYLISSQSISKIHNFFNGKLTLVLKPETPEKLVVSRDRSRLLKKWLDR
ncbi:LytR/AlgR family response regulator transcription factor [Pedobacter caeni]|uniref:Two component transcriptional regulator, LytTR family n=1 Tax=Pedobacter caeni TaxID=288992 RepID=A0A1M5GJ01_9SPHI|nr:LytTR family DNA-binding domain-containing protein [Pedobacter caeni]SHG03725.1 two component transcriptional regulator, LytTR family [Pedobacter caeni]